jgi:hypothetical protein
MLQSPPARVASARMAHRSVHENTVGAKIPRSARARLDARTMYRRRYFGAIHSAEYGVRLNDLGSSE